MKATVEKSLSYSQVKPREIFVEILNSISNCATEDELRYCMKKLVERYTKFSDYFRFGFGSHHMWVCENQSMERIILVEF